eukprot:765261-Hanusia_phi.AAC.1
MILGRDSADSQSLNFGIIRRSDPIRSSVSLGESWSPARGDPATRRTRRDRTVPPVPGQTVSSTVLSAAAAAARATESRRTVVP